MDGVARDIFRAIHEGRWLKIEYKNMKGEVTRYWIGIRNLDPARETLQAEGMHLGTYRIQTLDRIYIRSILSSHVLEGTWYPVNERLTEDIERRPEHYRKVFPESANLKILNYLEMCYRLDNVPYKKDYALVRYLDNDRLKGDVFPLSDEQFDMIVRTFQRQEGKEKKAGERLRVKRLGMNVLSIDTKKGLYVLAYRYLRLDVREHCLFPDDKVTICTEWTVDGVRKESIRKYLDADDFQLLHDFERNQEHIKNLITQRLDRKSRLDDFPYIIGMEAEILVDLHEEYGAIAKMMEKGEDAATWPMKAFFGMLLDRPRRRKVWPFALLDGNMNLDQLLAIHNAMRGPLAYIQGPPGTGKTSTIVNTLTTALMNERTVLFASYNNMPVDSVVRRLSNIPYRGKKIPFPILRVGNQEKVAEAISRIRELCEFAASMEEILQESVSEKVISKKVIPADLVSERALSENEVSKQEVREKGGTEGENDAKTRRQARARRLAAFLREYEELLDLREHQETLERLIDYSGERAASPVMLPFDTDIAGRQLQAVQEAIRKRGNLTEEGAQHLLEDSPDAFLAALYEKSLSHVRWLLSPQFDELRKIVFRLKGRDQTDAFSQYLRKSENVRKLQRAFPIIVTSCISAHRLGEPQPLFDLCILDEASQCNTAVSLMPILRGENLMLVGDPQQLNPVIQMDEWDNEILKKKYLIPEEYDYRQNSIYKVFLACDSVSDETLLRKHYRCRKEIIEFNNRKYYNSRLVVCRGAGSGAVQNNGTGTVAGSDAVQSNAAVAGSDAVRNNAVAAERDVPADGGVGVMRESGALMLNACSPGQDAPLLYVDLPDATSWEKNTSPSEARQVVEYALCHKAESIAVITPFVNQRKLIEEELKEAQIPNVACGTVHAFQGDERDVVLFSTAITKNTSPSTYRWLKNNRELINVATSRAKERLVVLSDSKSLGRLHGDTEASSITERPGERDGNRDDLFELVQYVKSNGQSAVTPLQAESRALGIKPFSTRTEEDFLRGMTHALENIWLSQNRFSIKKEVAISQVFRENITGDGLFYMGRFDFVVYERQGKEDIPVLCVELDGKEHFSSEAARERDRRKNEICRAHRLELVRVENSYARRYNHIKRILESYFARRH